jgi:DNA mismatch repair protein MSH5
LGCFVPASSAVIGLTDAIFTCLHSRDVPDTSSFLLDIQAASLALKNSSPQSLILLDEFGKGTLATDGIGLFVAVLLEFLSRKQCPRIIASTHFHGLPLFS